MYEAFSAKFVRNIDANRTIKDELTAAIRTQGARRRISVTDLVNPRKAFFSRTHPEIQPSADRSQAMMAGHNAGHLLIYGRGEFGRPPELRAYKLGFDDLEAIKAEIIHRRDQLSRALDTSDPAGLLRCTWYGRCEYESICGCAEAAELGRIVPAASVRIERDARLENLFAGKLGNDNSKVSGFRFFQLVFPRKAAFGLLDDTEDARATSQ